jgi:hypothetical protein
MIVERNEPQGATSDQDNAENLIETEEVCNLDNMIILIYLKFI